MLSQRDRLTIKHYDGAAFTDLSGLGDFLRDTASIELDGVDDYLYIGYYKPVASVYFLFDTPADAGATLVLEYYDETTDTWTELTKIDETGALSRDGFLHWDRLDVEDSEEQEVDGVTKHWVRISSDSLISATATGISLIFSDDQDLATQDPRVNDSMYLRTETTHIHAHISARDEIIQRLRNNGHIVVDENTLLWKDISPWDLLEVEQVRFASATLALSRIYRGLSDREDDTFWVKAEHHRELFEKAFRTITVAVDRNDDGVESASEKNVIQSTRYMYR